MPPRRARLWTVPTDELDRLHRIEEAARQLLSEWPGSRSATPLLAAMTAPRAALKEGAP